MLVNCNKVCIVTVNRSYEEDACVSMSNFFFLLLKLFLYSESISHLISNDVIMVFFGIYLYSGFTIAKVDRVCTRVIFCCGSIMYKHSMQFLLWHNSRLLPHQLHGHIREDEETKNPTTAVALANRTI